MSTSTGLIGTSAAARQLGCSEAWVRALALRGELPVVEQTSRGSLRFRPQDVAILAKQRATGRRRRRRKQYQVGQPPLTAA